MAKKYRPNVAAIILSPHYPKKCEFFLGERSDVRGAWQFPQGGIDEGENPQEALFRELLEEIGTDEVEILAQYPQWINYDFPEDVRSKMQPFDGQTQRYFLLRLKPNAKINLDTAQPEFVSYQFVEIAEVFRRVKSFKRDVYSKVLNYFKTQGYL